MTIAIMQPYLFPFIGYWQLIQAVDTFVVYDNIQFTKKGWFRHNNILLNGKKTLFSIPLKKDSDYLDVVDRMLSEDSDRQIKKIIARIEGSYRHAPYFNDAFPLIKDILGSTEKNLFYYIYNSIQVINEYLGIKTKIILSSTLETDEQLKADERVIAINKILHTDHYINAIGGLRFYEKDKFLAEGISLNFLNPEIVEYKQFDNEFVSYLSIIDIMMFNSKYQIKEMLGKYTLI